MESKESKESKNYSDDDSISDDDLEPEEADLLSKSFEHFNCASLIDLIQNKMYILFYHRTDPLYQYMFTLKLDIYNYNYIQKPYLPSEQ